MNIHINEDDFNKLKNLVICSTSVGSQLYNMSNEKSDLDILHIYISPENNRHSIVQLHHQFQYKQNNIDYLFVDLQTFVKNLLNGDSTINFEAIFSQEFKNSSDLSFLYENRFMFYNYNLIRSYLGLARRDIKDYKKEKNNKKLFHALRGFETAKVLFNKEEYSNDFSQREYFEKLKMIKSNYFDKEEKEFCEDLLLKVDTLRLALNKRLDNKEIQKIISAQDLAFLDNKIINISKKYTKSGHFENSTYYEAIQEDVKY
jgi:predicted nucleotidyltransferase